MMNKRVLVFGGTGLIGVPTVDELTKLGYQVTLAVRHERPDCKLNQVTFDMLADDPMQLFKHLAGNIDGIIDLAWGLQPDYKNSSQNLDWLIATCRMAKCAIEQLNIGKLMIAGSFFEYGTTISSSCEEFHTIRNPDTYYGKCKTRVFDVLTEYCSNQKFEQFKWPRIFSVFGPNENEYRLGPYVLKCIAEGKDIVLRQNAFYDYSYSKDVAGALAAFYDSEVSGPVNICSGKITSVRDLAEAICEKKQYDRKRIQFSIAGQLGLGISTANDRLKNEVKYLHKYDIRSGVNDYV